MKMYVCNVGKIVRSASSKFFPVQLKSVPFSQKAQIIASLTSKRAYKLLYP